MHMYLDNEQYISTGIKNIKNTTFHFIVFTFSPPLFSDNLLDIDSCPAWNVQRFVVDVQNC